MPNITANTLKADYWMKTLSFSTGIYESTRQTFPKIYYVYFGSYFILWPQFWFILLCFRILLHSYHLTQAIYMRKCYWFLMSVHFRKIVDCDHGHKPCLIYVSAPNWCWPLSSLYCRPKKRKSIINSNLLDFVTIYFISPTSQYLWLWT